MKVVFCLTGDVSSISMADLSFEQQKELLLLKLEHEKELERIKYKKEQLKLDLKLQKLAMIKDGRMSASALMGGSTCPRFDVAKRKRCGNFLLYV